jgi:protein-disulfide isomerase
MIRMVFLAALVLSAPLVAHAQGTLPRYPLAAEDGSPILNGKIKPGEAAEVEKLPGVIVVGNLQGDVTLAEFYDLNCPFCRRASADLEELIKSDPKLRVVLVPFPVLGVPSVLAGRVELAVAKSIPPEKFYQFHRALYAGRGIIDGQRALALATGEFGLDAQKVVDAANDDATTETMKSHLRFADKFGLKATPAYLIHDVAIQGHPGRKTLQSVIASVRKCKKAVC